MNSRLCLRRPTLGCTGAGLPPSAQSCYKITFAGKRELIHRRLCPSEVARIMSRHQDEVEAYIKRLLRQGEVDALAEKLQGHGDPPPDLLPTSSHLDQAARDRRWRALEEAVGERAARVRAQWEPAPPETGESLAAYEKNIENFAGFVRVPIGIAGPLRINGLHATGDYFLPLATTEAALVASYSRGCQALTQAGGCACALLSESVSRCPGFIFRNLGEVGRCVIWIQTHLPELKEAAEATTRHGKLLGVRYTVEGNHLYLLCEYSTGDASGQNMVTIATEALCRHLVEHLPVPPLRWFVEANMSGDKKASMLAFLGVRGRKVSAEISLPPAIVQRRLRTTAAAMAEYWQVSALGGVMSGTIGVQGHFANGLAALFLATGQDVACVAEAAVGITRMEVQPDNSLYVAVTLPNLLLGTVGGGTRLPSQQAGLELLGLAGPGKAAAFAEVTAGLCLAGEISIIAALSAGHFTSAHRKLARPAVGSP